VYTLTIAPDHGGAIRRISIAVGLRLLPAWDRLLMRFSDAKEHQVFPNDLFFWPTFLEQNWEVIRAEAQSVLKDKMSVPAVREISPDHDKIAIDEKWRSYFFWGYGLRVEEHCTRCPETARILERIPGLLTAFYSVMLADAHVPRHTGPTKAILTAHLGLIIPRQRERCRMVVGDHTVVWEEGRLVIFDDMFPHEVWNDTEEDRIVLLLHVKRPLRFPGSMLRDMLFGILRASPFVQDGVRNLQRWERSVHAGGLEGESKT
jgi:aspartyl/asparaginyl beta-hydroxylase (cupin superfamily)